MPPSTATETPAATAATTRRHALFEPRPARKALLLWLENNEFAAAVLGPRGFAVARIGRAVFAKADGVNTVAIDSEVDQILANGQRAALSKGEVVLLGAALVAVSFDQDAHVGIALEIPGDGLDFAGFARLDRRAVKVKINRVGSQGAAVLIGLARIEAAFNRNGTVSTDRSFTLTNAWHVFLLIN